MKKKVIMLSTVAILGVFTLSVFAQGKEEEDKPKCKTDHTAVGFCTWSVEGTAECVTATQSFNCCHSGS